MKNLPDNLSKEKWSQNNNSSLEFESLPDDIIVPLSLNEINQAIENTERIGDNSQEWELYLYNLALTGFKKWVREEIEDLTITNEECTVVKNTNTNVIDVIANLQVNYISFALLVTNSLFDENILVSKQVIERYEHNVRFYVLIEVLEEEELVIINNFIPFDDLVKKIEQNKSETIREELLLDKNRDEEYHQISIYWFTKTAYTLVLYLQSLKIERENKTLLGEINDTIIRLSILDYSLFPESSNLYEKDYSIAKFNDLIPVVNRFLIDAENERGKLCIPGKAYFTVADPVINKKVELANLSWSLEEERLAQQLNIPIVSLINDFTAIGYGILGLESKDLITLQDVEVQPGAPIAVVGAGSYLEEGFLIKQGEKYKVFATAGGYEDFAPRNELEFKLLQYICNKNGLNRCSVERVVSESGIISIYQFLRDTTGEVENSVIANVIRTWENDSGSSKSDVVISISNAALNNADLLSVETMRIFVSCYGAEVHNFALKLLPYGGLYIAGSIAPKILPLMQNGNFLKNFIEGGTMTSLLQNIPIHIIINEEVKKIGIRLLAGDHI